MREYLDIYIVSLDKMVRVPTTQFDGFVVYISDRWAIHKSIENARCTSWNQKALTLTHIPSGCGMFLNINNYKTALKVVKLLDNSDVQWDTIKDWTTLKASVSQSLLKACKAILVKE
jgi:hypothetical protein